MTRTILIHLNVSMPDDDSRDADEVSEEIRGALEVGLEGAPEGFLPSSRVTIALAEEL